MKMLGLLLLGFIVGVISCMVSIPLIRANYEPIAEVVNMIDQLKPYKKHIEIILLKERQTGQLILDKQIFSQIENRKLDYFRIAKEDGSLIFRLKKYKQIIILTPHVKSQNIVWECIGAPSERIPLFCR